MLKRLAAILESSPVGRWFAGKEPREQWAYIALAVAVATVFLWTGIWRPLSDWRSVQVNRHDNAQVLRDWLLVNEPRVRAVVAAQGIEDSGHSVLPLVTRAAESQGIKVGRVQPESGGVVSVTLQSQPFNDLVAWVAELQDTQGITVVRGSIDAQGTPGLVNAQLRFQ